MPGSGEVEVIWHVLPQTQLTEPAVRQIEVNFLAEPPLRADAEAIADQQHLDHQRRIDRRTPSWCCRTAPK